MLDLWNRIELFESFYSSVMLFNYSSVLSSQVQLCYSADFPTFVPLVCQTQPYLVLALFCWSLKLLHEPQLFDYCIVNITSQTRHEGQCLTTEMDGVTYTDRYEACTYPHLTMHPDSGSLWWYRDLTKLSLVGCLWISFTFNFSLQVVISGVTAGLSSVV